MPVVVNYTDKPENGMVLKQKQKLHLLEINNSKFFSQFLGLRVAKNEPEKGRKKEKRKEKIKEKAEVSQTPFKLTKGSHFQKG